MKKKVLMVYPEIPNTYWSLEYGLSFVNKKTLMVPLGLLTVASLLPDEYEVKLVDMNVASLDPRDIEAADIVFISAMIVQKNSFEHVVELCNRCGKTVVAGGPYPTSSCGEIHGVDYFVLNEAEITLPQFLADYEKGKAKSVYRDETKPDITRTPVPRYDLIDGNQYACMAVQFSRGCPFNCEFCDIIEMFGRKPRTKDVAQFLNELQAVYDTGFRGPVFVVDDNFIGNRKRVRDLLRGIVEWQKEHDHPFSLFTEASINLAYDEELIDLMVEAGFNMVFVGIETPDAKSLASAGKTQNLREDIFESVKRMQVKGLEVLGGFIVGFDTDTEDIFDRQIEFIQRAGIPMAMMGILMPLPNTQLYRRLKKEKRLINAASGNNLDLDLNFIPVMPKEKLIAGYKRMLKKLYSPKMYFERTITLLERLPQTSLAGRPLRRRDLKAFGLSLVRQTLSSYGFWYLSFLIKAFRVNRSHFPLAVNLAIKGYHFFRMTDEILAAGEFTEMLHHSLGSLKSHLAEIVNDGTAAIASKVESFETRLAAVKRTMHRKYRQMNFGVRSYLHDSIKEFEANLNALTSKLDQKLRSEEGAGSGGYMLVPEYEGAERDQAEGSEEKYT